MSAARAFTRAEHAAAGCALSSTIVTACVAWEKLGAWPRRIVRPLRKRYYRAWAKCGAAGSAVLLSVCLSRRDSPVCLTAA